MIPVNRNTERINIHIQEKQEQVKQEKPRKFEKDVVGNENRAPGNILPGHGAVGKENAGIPVSNAAVRASSFRKRKDPLTDIKGGDEKRHIKEDKYLMFGVGNGAAWVRVGAGLGYPQQPMDLDLGDSQTHGILGPSHDRGPTNGKYVYN